MNHILEGQKKFFHKIFLQGAATYRNEKSQEQIAQLVDKATKLYQDFRNISANTDKSNSLKIEIDKVERQIDQEIYKFYGLTNEEIRTIEE